MEKISFINLDVEILVSIFMTNYEMCNPEKSHYSERKSAALYYYEYHNFDADGEIIENGK